jgi:hypothetical protein
MLHPLARPALVIVADSPGNAPCGDPFEQIPPAEEKKENESDARKGVQMGQKGKDKTENEKSDLTRNSDGIQILIQSDHINPSPLRP